MISVRQAMVLTGIIALVMVTLAASSVLAPGGTASEGDNSPADVRADNGAIETIAGESTDGCNPPADECPGSGVATGVEVVSLGEVVTRAEMAMLLSRALELTTRADNPFVDDDGSTFEADIERLVAAGITNGCNPPHNDRFCPDALLTRQEAAALLARGFGLTARADDPFVDDDGTIFEADIERLAAAGITNGCNPPSNTKFCPTDLVTGAQIMTFLTRAGELSPIVRKVDS